MTSRFPKFADLFAPNAPSNSGSVWQLTPRTAYALWEAADNLAHLVAMDIGDNGSASLDPIDSGDRCWYVFHRYPPLTFHQAELWRIHAGYAFLDLAEVLASGERPYPRTAAEEMGLWLILEDAELRLGGGCTATAGCDPDTLPEYQEDYNFDDLRSSLFHDHDILMLFQPHVADAEDPGIPLHGVVPDIADYRPEHWFDTFWNDPPRHPERETYKQEWARTRTRKKARPRPPAVRRPTSSP